MSNSIYAINKGINKSIEFKGLKAQYIWYLGGGVLVLLVLFAAMYIAGLNQFLCIGIILLAGSGLVWKVYGMSHKYGEHGMMKMMARKRVPKVIKCNSRKIFIQLKEKEDENGKKTGI
ncbi:DUF4133 domain-containing protein [Taibaiella koreensis]|uniref:DUF4133 domain-containing protein n=1 Tax=Taibaiella koreensis TaxID=1268548 RepID=UPI000E59C2F3|nr:DUF4133 domain-containing protein [Taibaiella koreensis]